MFIYFINYDEIVTEYQMFLFIYQSRTDSIILYPDDGDYIDWLATGDGDLFIELL